MRKKCHFSVGVLDREIERERERESLCAILWACLAVEIKLAVKSQKTNFGVATQIKNKREKKDEKKMSFFRLGVSD